MNRTMFVAVLTAGVVAAASRGEAALVSSSAMFNELLTTSLTYSSIIRDAPVGGSFLRTRNYSSAVQAGINSAAITVDTVLDSGVVNAIGFKPLGGSPSVGTQTFSVNFVKIVEPANFPLPAVTKQVTGQYSETITINSVTGAAPSLVSSQPGAIFATTPPYFRMDNLIAVAPSSFFINGTYQAVGPTSNMSAPFSVEYRAVGTPFFASFIEGGVNFGPNFPFLAQQLVIAYQPVNPLLFDGVVDDLHFRASFNSDTRGVPFVRGVSIPEPAMLGMAAPAAMGLAALRRRRR